MIAGSSCDSLCFASIAIPNIFSPNGDGLNDTFHVLHFCQFDPFTMHIYNRWGEKVFESHDIAKGWDGKYKNEMQPSEEYMLFLAFTLPGRETIYKSTVVRIVR